MLNIQIQWNSIWSWGSTRPLNPDRWNFFQGSSCWPQPTLINDISDILNIHSNTNLSERKLDPKAQSFMYHREGFVFCFFNKKQKTNPCSFSLFSLSLEKKKNLFSTIRTILPSPVIDAVKLDVCGTLALANEHINWWPAVSNYYTLVN